MTFPTAFESNNTLRSSLYKKYSLAQKNWKSPKKCLCFYQLLIWKLHTFIATTSFQLIAICSRKLNCSGTLLSKFGGGGMTRSQVLVYLHQYYSPIKIFFNNEMGIWKCTIPRTRNTWIIIRSKPNNFLTRFVISLPHERPTQSKHCLANIYIYIIFIFYGFSLKI